MNPAKLFVSAKDIPENKLVGRIALNEDNVPGILVKVKTINTTKIYVGFDLEKGTEWVSLDPVVMTVNIAMRAAIDLFYVLRDAKREEFKTKLDISVSPPMSTEEVMSDLENATWSQISFTKDSPPEALQDFLNKIFGQDTPNNNSNNSSFDDNYFEIDNDDEDSHNN
jgi:hypothetical protein